MAIAKPNDKRYFVFATVSLGLFMASVDSTVVATALPTLTREMGAPINWTGWTISAYLFGQTVAMPIVGKISDVWGRRRVLLGCTMLFTVASVLCGLSVNVFWLIGFRFLQALGGGGFMPSATGIVSDAFGKNRDRAIGMFVSIFPLGALVGPAIGALILNYTSWRAIFFVNVPFGVALLFLIRAYVKADDRVERRLQLDVAGAASLCGCLLCLMLALTLLGDRSVTFGSPQFVALLSISILLGVLFARRERSAAYPLVSVALLRSRPFAIVNGLNVIYGSCALGFAALVPLFGQDAYRMTPLAAGSLLSARGVAMIIFAALASWLLRKTGYRLPIAIGFGGVALGLLMMAETPMLIGAYPWLLVSACITGVGLGLAGPASNNAALQLQPDSAAAIAGLRGMFRQVGGITSISIATLVLAREANQSAGFGQIFIGLAALLVLSVPAIMGVPERANLTYAPAIPPSGESALLP